MDRIVTTMVMGRITTTMVFSSILFWQPTYTNLTVSNNGLLGFLMGRIATTMVLGHMVTAMVLIARLFTLSVELCCTAMGYAHGDLSISAYWTSRVLCSTAVDRQFSRIHESETTKVPAHLLEELCRKNVFFFSRFLAYSFFKTILLGNFHTLRAQIG